MFLSLQALLKLSAFILAAVRWATIIGDNEKGRTRIAEGERSELQDKLLR